MNRAIVPTLRQSLTSLEFEQPRDFLMTRAHVCAAQNLATLKLRNQDMRMTSSGCCAIRALLGVLDDDRISRIERELLAKFVDGRKQRVAGVFFG